MKEIKNDVIKKYQYKDYYIYIIETDEAYEYYLKHKDYGIIALIFGLMKKQNSFEDFMDIVGKNIECDIEYYRQTYEDEQAEIVKDSI